MSAFHSTVYNSWNKLPLHITHVQVFVSFIKKRGPGLYFFVKNQKWSRCFKIWNKLFLAGEGVWPGLPCLARDFFLLIYKFVCVATCWCNVWHVWIIYPLNFCVFSKQLTGPVRGGVGRPPPLFGDRKDFNQSHCSGNWLNLNFYICKFSVAPKLWILHLFF